MLSPRTWTTRTVDELCVKITSGGTPRRNFPEYYNPGTVPWVKTGDLHDQYLTDYDEHISELGMANSSAKLLPPDTVLMAMYGATVGKLGMLIEPACCNQASCAMISNPDVCEPRWLFYTLLNDRANIESNANGAAQQNLSAQSIRKFVYNCPPLNEQRAIAEVLGALDDKIAANTKLSHTTAALARLLVADQRPTIPLAEIVTHHKKPIHPSSMSQSSVAHFSLPAFDAGEIPELDAAETIKSSKFAIEQPSVLVSKLNPRFPRIWDVPSLPEISAVSSTEFLVLEPRVSTTSVLWALLHHPSFSSELESKVSGTSGSHQRVRPGDLLATCVIDPRSLTSHIQDELTDLGQILAQSRFESQSLAETRDALLPHLMSGRLRVKDAEKQVEEVL